jgi:hypothetical protein
VCGAWLQMDWLLVGYSNSVTGPLADFAQSRIVYIRKTHGDRTVFNPCVRNRD